MVLLIRNAEVFAPEPAGRRDVLIGGGRVLRVGTGIRVHEDWCEVLDAAGRLLVPGFIDAHVHVTGGGGEGGFATRTPELPLSEAIRGGITTVVGCLGTDGVTRSLAGLLAKVRGLDEQGITAFMLTGDYAVPVHTLTGSIERDLLFVDKIVGVGEIALADHRSTQPTFDEFLRLASEARRGGILSGKAGVVNVHMGDGRRGLDYLRRAVAETEIPPGQFVPTHVNRNPTLFEEGIEYARAGGLVDFTTSTVPAFIEEGEVKSSRGLRRMLEAGVPLTQVTFTSDGQGSLPKFDAHGRMAGIGVGRVTSLFAEVRDAVLVEKLPLEIALAVVTANPARIYKLRRKGSISPGYDADLVLLEPGELVVRGVIAKGRWLMKDGELLAKGTFE
jgi:beta-aspartyl-dipeptidase (metallo-type)